MRGACQEQKVVQSAVFPVVSGETLFHEHHLLSERELQVSPSLTEVDCLGVTRAAVQVYVNQNFKRFLVHYQTMVGQIRLWQATIF